MSKQDFLNELRDSLQGEVSAAVIADNIRYYDSYIDTQVNDGKTEEEVLEELGRGSFIAKSIIEAKTNKYKETVNSFAEEETKKGFHAEFNDDGSADIKYGKFNFNSWYGKVVLVILGILAVIAVIAIILAVLALAWYVVIPVILLGLVLFAIYVLVNRIYKR